MSLRGDVSKLTDLQLRLGLKLVGNMKFDPRTMTFFELAVSPHSSVVGRRIRDLHFWRDFGAVVVALLRHGHHIQERASGLILRPGDMLLVCGDQSSPARLRASTDFFLVTGAHRLVVLRGHARRALAIAAGVVVLFAANSIFGLKAIPIPIAALLGAIAMVWTGCVTARRAYRVIDWPILIFVVGTLAPGRSNAGNRRGRTVRHRCRAIPPGLRTGRGPRGLGFACHFVQRLCFPQRRRRLAHSGRDRDGTRDARSRPPAPFLLAVAFGGSIAFATPLGHQVSLMVYGPGGYKYTDFLRMGIPLSIISWLFVTFAIAYQFDWL